MNNDDDKKDDAMMALQTRLINDNEDELMTNALLVQQDEEQPPERIEVFGPVTRGEKQDSQYRDAPFAIIWVVHLLAILGFALAWGLPALFSSAENSNSNNDDNATIENLNIGGLLGLCLLCTVASLGILSGTLAFMIRYSEIFIQCSLIGSIAFSLLFAVLLALGGLWVPAVVYLLLAALGAWYACCVWRRIPFARANLKTATRAVRDNLGVIGVAFGMVCGLFVWTCLWMLSYGGIYMHTQKCQNGECDENAVGQIVGVLYLLSFYWTSEVIKNILVATVAGVVGTFWFAPDEASSFWSSAITDSLTRATTYSLGSICFGSLLMAMIQVLRQMVQEARRRGRGNDLLLCILECLVSCLESVADYFNRYAFIYVGLYGYKYLDAGKKVIQLFTERGWTTIINDQLVYRVLNLMTLVVAGLTGCVGLLVAHLIPTWVESLEDARLLVAFLLPFLIGLALAHVVFGVLASAVDSVIVCFAESPNEFQANYPDLSQEMLNSWRQIYPTLGL